MYYVFTPVYKNGFLGIGPTRSVSGIRLGVSFCTSMAFALGSKGCARDLST